MKSVHANVKCANAIALLLKLSANRTSTHQWRVRQQIKMECVENLKIIARVLVDVAKVKTIFSRGSIAITIYAAMVMSLKLECAESLMIHKLWIIDPRPFWSAARAPWAAPFDPETTRRLGIPIEYRIPAIILFWLRCKYTISKFVQKIEHSKILKKPLKR